MIGRQGYRLPVRWRDFDALGHVNTVVFLTFLEEGRNLWLSEVLGPGFDPKQYVVARFEVDLITEVPVGTATVRTDHTVTAIGTSSITLEERLYRDDATPVAQCRIVLVMWEPEERRSRPLAPAEREALSAQTAAV